jgi:uncharacterized protein (DUF433 family)
MLPEALARPAYVEEREGIFVVRDSRVSLDSIVHAFWSGQTAESIAQSIPTLTLEQVYGAIAFYLGRRAEVDAYLETRKAAYEAAREKSRAGDPTFYEKLSGLKRS